MNGMTAICTGKPIPLSVQKVKPAYKAKKKWAPPLQIEPLTEHSNAAKQVVHAYYFCFLHETHAILIALLVQWSA
jgi:hypothetical protein